MLHVVGLRASYAKCMITSRVNINGPLPNQGPWDYKEESTIVPLANMAQLQEAPSQHANGPSDALHRLKGQRWQHAGQRLQAVAQSWPVQTSSSAAEQQLQPSSHCFERQQAVVYSVHCKHHAPQKQLARPICRSSQQGNGVLQTSVKGMQYRPPSRASSAEVSLDSQQHHYAGKLQYRPGACVALLTTGSQLVSMCAQQHASMSPGTDCLEVQGTCLVGQQAMIPSQHKARAVAGRMKATAVQTAAHAAGSWALGSLGCGIPWVQVKHLAAAVHKKALHHSNLEHQRHRLQLAKAVVDQWRWWVCRRRQQHLADSHYGRQLMLAGWSGFQSKVSHQRLLQCQALLWSSKHTFMLMSQCFLAWRQLLVQQQHMIAAVTAHQHRWHKQSLQEVMRKWHLQASSMQRKRQLLLRAQAHHTFMSMLRCLHVWHTWVVDQQLTRLKLNRASQHWQRTVQQHVVSCWQEHVAQATHEWQQLAKALCFRKCTLQSTAIGCWKMAIARLQQSRASAAQCLQQWRKRQLTQTLPHAVRAWRSIAEQQGYLHQMHEQLSQRLQQQRMCQVVRRWYCLVQYQQQLAVAAGHLSAVGESWWCRHYMGRWQGMVEVMAGQRTAELRQLVQLRACIGTWLKFAEQQRMIAAKSSAATAALQHKKLVRIFPAWQRTVAALQQDRQLHVVAAEHFAVHQLRRLFLLWWQHAVELAEEQQQLIAAAELHHDFLLDHSWRTWHWYWWHSSIKRSVPEYYLSTLQQRAVTAWRGVTAKSLCKEVQRRQAVRHHYLSTLSRVTAAWHQVLHMSAVKQQLVRAADEHCKQLSMRRAFKIWYGPFMHHKVHKRTQLARATSLFEQQLKQQAVRAWLAALAAGQTERLQQSAADQHLQRQRLQWAMKAWLEMHQQEHIEKQQLVVAAQPVVQALQRRLQRRVLHAWQQVQAQQQAGRQKLLRGQLHYMRLLLLHSIGSWRLYLEQQQAKAAGRKRAAQHRRSKVAAAVLQCLRCNADAAGLKRQQLFVAALHRRSWLVSKAWRSWRLTCSMSRLEQAVSPLQATGQPHAAVQTSMSSTLQQQQPAELGLDAIAAAVVAASCCSLDHWQQHWKQQWQADARPHEQQQQQQSSASKFALSTASFVQPAVEQLHGLQGQHVEQLQQPLSPHGVTVGRPVTSKAAARRPPRLPSFMQAQGQQTQQQCWQQALQETHRAAANTARHVSPHTELQSAADRQQQQWLPVDLLPAAEQGMQLLLTSCSPWQGQAPCLSPYQQPQQRTATCIQGAVAAAPAVAGWSTPRASKPRRPQPRQLRTATAGCPASTQEMTAGQQVHEQRHHLTFDADHTTAGQMVMQLSCPQHQHRMGNQQHQDPRHGRYDCSSGSNVLFVHHEHQELCTLPDIILQSSCSHQQHEPAHQGCNSPGWQREGRIALLLPHTPCTHTSSNTPIAGQLNFNPHQQQNVATSLANQPAADVVLATVGEDVVAPNAPTREYSEAASAADECTSYCSLTAVLS